MKRIHYDLHDNNIDYSHSQSLLNKFISSWEQRAQVRNYSLLSEKNCEEAVELSKPDFLEELLPIKNCPSYHLISYNQKKLILSYAWLAYNAKTIAIESKIISPVCYDIIYGHVPGVKDNESRKIIAETLTDESYHILLCQHAMAITEKNRKISRTIFPEFDLVTKCIELEKSHPRVWQRMLIRIAVAIVSEIFISDYLKMLSCASDIGFLNRETVRVHRLDEVAHGKIFTELAKLIYQQLTNVQKNFFASILHFPIQYFASKELVVWHSILSHVCPELATQIICEARAEEWFDLSHLDYGDLIVLADELGIKNFTQNIDQVNHIKKI